MVKQLALFYRDVSKDYIINTGNGETAFNTKTCEIFPNLEKAVDYLIKNYRQRKSELYLDEECGALHENVLEKKLAATKIKIIR